MSIASQCPGCSRKFSAPEQLLGKSVRCPQCNHQFVVQAEPSAAITSAAPDPMPAPPGPSVTDAPETPAPRSKRGLVIGLGAAAAALVAFTCLGGGGYLVYALLFRGPTADWKEFASNEGNFTVLLPPNPAQKEQPDPKINYKIRAVSAEPAKATNYSVQYFDIADKPINNHLYFAWLKNHLLAGGGKLARENEVNLESYPGRELIVELPNDEVLVRRVYLADARVFFLTAQYPKGKSAGAAQKFFESFKITSAPKTVAAAAPPPPAQATPPQPTNPIRLPPIILPPATTQPMPPVTASFPVKAEEQALVDAFNRFRQAEKVGVVKPMKELFDAARIESEEKAGLRPAGKQAEFKFSTFRLGVPVRGTVSAQQVVSHMAAARSLRNQAVEPDYENIGVGISTGKDGVTQYTIILGGKPR